MEKKFWIVWNDAKSEGVILEDIDDVNVAAGVNPPHQKVSALAQYFSDSYAEDERDIQCVEIEV